jgi:hypothetical protein
MLLARKAPLIFVCLADRSAPKRSEIRALIIQAHFRGARRAVERTEYSDPPSPALQSSEAGRQLLGRVRRKLPAVKYNVLILPTAGHGRLSSP